jgi:hypothetical protein
VGNLNVLIGAIIGATASSVWVVVPGQVLPGLRLAHRSQARAIISKIFRHKHRPLIQGEHTTPHGSRKEHSQCCCTTGQLTISPLLLHCLRTNRHGKHKPPGAVSSVTRSYFLAPPLSGDPLLPTGDLPPTNVISLTGQSACRLYTTIHNHSTD